MIDTITLRAPARCRGGYGEREARRCYVDEMRDITFEAREIIIRYQMLHASDCCLPRLLLPPPPLSMPPNKNTPRRHVIAAAAAAVTLVFRRAARCRRRCSPAAAT